MSESQKINLKIETRELISRVNRLQDFMRTKEFYELNRIDKDLLYEQFEHMMKYLRVLGLRCEMHRIELDIEEVR